MLLTSFWGISANEWAEWTGDADGLGEVRKKELVQSCLRLGIKADSDVTIIEHRFFLSPLPLSLKVHI